MPLAAPGEDREPGLAEYAFSARLGPLGWFYRYDLISSVSAADFLARWALLRSKRHPQAPRLVTLLRHDQGTLLTVETLAVRTDDGKTARLVGRDPGSGQGYDQAGLTRVMSCLFAPAK